MFGAVIRKQSMKNSFWLATMLSVFCTSPRTHATNPSTHPTTLPAPHEIARLYAPGGTFTSFSRDGALILTANDKEAQVWNADNYAEVGEVMDHGEGLCRVEFDAAAKKVLTVGFTNGHQPEFKVASGEAKLWDARTGKPILASIRHGDLPLFDLLPTRFVTIFAFELGGQFAPASHERFKIFVVTGDAEPFLTRIVT